MSHSFYPLGSSEMRGQANQSRPPMQLKSVQDTFIFNQSKQDKNLVQVLHQHYFLSGSNFQEICRKMVFAQYEPPFLLFGCPLPSFLSIAAPPHCCDDDHPICASLCTHRPVSAWSVSASRICRTPSASATCNSLPVRHCRQCVCVRVIEFFVGALSFVCAVCFYFLSNSYCALCGIFGRCIFVNVCV